MYSYEYVLIVKCHVVGCIPLVITNLFIIPSGGDIIGHFFMVTQQHSVYATLHYLCGSIIYSTQGEASLFLCSLLVYYEQDPGEKAYLFLCGLSPGVFIVLRERLLCFSVNYLLSL